MFQGRVRDRRGIHQGHRIGIGLLGDAHIVDPERLLFGRGTGGMERQEQEPAFLGEEVQSFPNRAREGPPLGADRARQRPGAGASTNGRILR